MFSTPPAPRRVFQPALRVEIALDGDRPRFLGYGADLSTTGVFVQSMRPKEPGTVLGIRLHLPSPASEAIVCVGEVMWTRGYSGPYGRSPGMGLRFLDLPASSLEILARLYLHPQLSSEAPKADTK